MDGWMGSYVIRFSFVLCFVKYILTVLIIIRCIINKSQILADNIRSRKK